MIVSQDLTPKITAYDIREIKKHSNKPIKVVCAAIKQVIEPIVNDNQRMTEVYLGVEEMVKDVLVHGNAKKPKYIFVTETQGFVDIDTYDEKKKRSVHNNLGHKLLQAYFGTEFYTEENGSIFRSHVTIKAEDSESTARQLDLAA